VVQIFTAMLFCKVGNTNCICGVKLAFQEDTTCIDDIGDLQQYLLYLLDCVFQWKQDR
jgi:hypothetical protein